MADTWAPKDPGDERDYWFNCAPLIARGATVTAATVTIAANQHDFADPYTDLEKVTSAITDGTWVVIRVTGGTPAQYTIDYYITDSTGQKIDFNKTLAVKERIIP